MSGVGGWAVGAARVTQNVSAASKRRRNDSLFFALWFAGFAQQGPGCGRASRLRRHVIKTATGRETVFNCRGQRRSGRGRGVVLQVTEGGANYGVNPTRLAPQAAAVVCAVEQDVWCGWLGRRRRAGYAKR
jgi:hypothetical protein